MQMNIALLHFNRPFENGSIPSLLLTGPASLPPNCQVRRTRAESASSVRINSIDNHFRSPLSLGRITKAGWLLMLLFHRVDPEEKNMFRCRLAWWQPGL